MQKSIQNQQEWFDSPLGQYLLRNEQAYFEQMVSDIFGFNAVQLGFTQHDFLSASRIPNRCTVERIGPAKLLADFQHLPFATQSVDLIILPHVLEFNANPHQILREVERILMPEGQVILSGFNPWSLWGIRHMFGAESAGYPWDGRFINLPRLKDWLALLGFEISGGRMCCYAPPVKREKWLARFNFLEHAGDRWWAMGGGVYFLQAIKRVHSMRLIMPKWNEGMAANNALAPAAQKVVNLFKDHDK